MIYAVLSLLCSFLTILLLWLMLPLFVLPPLGIFFAFKFYRHRIRHKPGRMMLARLLALALAGIAVASFVTAAQLISTGYRA
ncbi:MAG: hypothetical protein ACLGI6_03765 [Gammaproteobacteria bacterium]